MTTDEAIALLKAEQIMLCQNGKPISNLYYAVGMAIEALNDSFELWEYRQCGSVEDCRTRMEWMSLSMDDVRKNYIKIIKEAREIVAEKTSENQAKRKRCRPKKAEGGQGMTREQIVQARNASFEAMLMAQGLMDKAVTPNEKNIAEAIYEAHNALYWVLVDIERRKRERGEKDGGTDSSLRSE